jgi:hypothetical protein
MTPEHYVKQVTHLLEAGEDQAALDFAAQMEPTVQPRLSAEQVDLVGGLLEGAILAVQLAQAERARESAGSA